MTVKPQEWRVAVLTRAIEKGLTPAEVVAELAPLMQNPTLTINAADAHELANDCVHPFTHEEILDAFNQGAANHDSKE